MALGSGRDQGARGTGGAPPVKSPLQSQQPARSVVPAGWLSPGQAAKLLGYRGKRGLLHAQVRGVLRPVKDERGVRRFNPDEVATYARTRADLADRRHEPRLRGDARTSGQIAGAVFRRLNAGEDLRDIIATEDIEPQVAIALWHVWSQETFERAAVAARVAEARRAQDAQLAQLQAQREAERATQKDSDPLEIWQRMKREREREK